MAYEEDNKGVFAGVNFATVVASAIAAGTAFALANYIGIAGSLIGAVVAAAVSSISSQFYQGIINKSAGKIKDVADAALTQPLAPVAPEPANASDETCVLGLGEAADHSETEAFFMGDTVMSNTIMGEATTGDTAMGDTVIRPRPLDTGAPDSGQTAAPGKTPIASDELIQAAHAHEARDFRRRMLIVTIGAALAALALTAVAIFALTAGEGIGSKPSYTPVVATEDEDTEQVDTPAEDAEQTEDAQTVDTPVETTETPSVTETPTDSADSSTSTDTTTPEVEPSTQDSSSTSSDTSTTTEPTSETSDESSTETGTPAA